MGVVMEKLPHPYKLTHKITSKNGKGFFFFWCVEGFPERGREERGERIFFSNFLNGFLRIFS